MLKNATGKYFSIKTTEKSIPFTKNGSSQDFCAKTNGHQYRYVKNETERFLRKTTMNVL